MNSRHIIHASAKKQKAYTEFLGKGGIEEINERVNEIPGKNIESFLKNQTKGYLKGLSLEFNYSWQKFLHPMIYFAFLKATNKDFKDNFLYKSYFNIKNYLHFTAH